MNQKNINLNNEISCIKDENDCLKNTKLKIENLLKN